MCIRPDVSIVIRTKNEGKSIGKCLQMVYEQNTRYDFEVIVIDSGSCDDTLDVCRTYPVIIHEIPPSEFNFGRTLNLGAQLAQGKYMVALTAHAFPANEDWLEPLVSALESDQTIAGAYSRQLPQPGCQPFEAMELERGFVATKMVLEKPPAKARSLLFSNVSSCMRKDILIEIPFRELPYAEDRDWAKNVLDRGHRIAYVPESMVFHSHNYGIRRRYEILKKTGHTYLIVDGDRTRVRRLLKYLFLPKVLQMYRQYYRAMQQQGLGGLYLLKWAFLCLAYRFVGDWGEFVGSRFGLNGDGDEDEFADGR